MGRFSSGRTFRCKTKYALFSTIAGAMRKKNNKNKNSLFFYICARYEFITRIQTIYSITDTTVIFLFSAVRCSVACYDYIMTIACTICRVVITCWIFVRIFRRRTTKSRSSPGIPYRCTDSCRKLWIYILYVARYNARYTYTHPTRAGPDGLG